MQARSSKQRIRRNLPKPVKQPWRWTPTLLRLEKRTWTRLVDKAVANDATEDEEKSRMPRQTPIYNANVVPSRQTTNANIFLVEIDLPSKH